MLMSTVVVAPAVFIVLSQKAAASYLRVLFPRLFMFGFLTSSIATLDYKNDQPTLTAHHAATILPEFIEWENFILNRKTLTLTNLSMSPRKQECVVVTFEELIERAKAHLTELQKGIKI